jgi:hypothetical protein
MSGQVQNLLILKCYELSGTTGDITIWVVPSW